MLYEVVTTKRFNHEIALAKKRGLDDNELFAVVEKLANGETLPRKNRDHALKGEFKGTRECHIHADWLLMYERDVVIKLITLVRTGTHADLYGK